MVIYALFLCNDSNNPMKEIYGIPILQMKRLKHTFSGFALDHIADGCWGWVLELGIEPKQTHA